jgi:hypothetical protein
MLLVARLPLLAALLLSAGEPARAQRESQSQTAEDRRILEEARVPTDGPGLVRFLRRQILTAADEQRVGELVGQLASRTFKVRDRAAAELTARGPAVLPLLRRAPRGPDLESQRRLERCIEAVEKIPWDKVAAAVARRLQALRPEGACPALLAFLPFAGKEDHEEMLNALLALGVRDGKPDPDFDAALRDAAPARRAAAALVLGRHGDAKQRAAVRRVLQGDLYLSVRLRAAEGLLEAGDASPVPVLLAVVAEGSPDLARRAEDMLRWLAEEKGPAVLLGNGPAERRKAHDAWQAWWAARGGKLALPAAGLTALRANPSRLARKTADRFIRAVLFSPSLAEMRKTTDVPFAVLSEKTYKTRAELDAAFEKEFKSDPNEDTKRLKMTVKYVLRPGEYEKKLPDDKGEREREFLRGLRGQPVLIVLVELTQPEGNGMRTEKVALYIRVRGGDARVIAIGGVG